MTDATPDDARLAAMLALPVFWIARAMQQQGSRFHQALGTALEAADLVNRRLIFQTWPEACWDFYQRALLLEQQEGST